MSAMRKKPLTLYISHLLHACGFLHFAGFASCIVLTWFNII